MQAIKIAGGTVSASSHCVGCGACSLVCPTGAIRVEGFDPPPVIRTHLEIECARTPHAKVGSRSWTVPCFAGLRVATLVEVFEHADQSELAITIKDRGLCAGCVASAQTELAQEVQARLSSAMQSTGSKAIRVGLAFEPLSPAEAIPLGARANSSRRTFLRRLMGAAAQEPRSFSVLDDRMALERVAARVGNELDAAHYPELVISDACLDHGICTASCPTGALRRDEGGAAGETRRMLFEAAACVGCGRCGEVCPEKALQFHAHGTGPAPSGPVVLRETRLAVCPKCEDTFIPNDTSDLCGSCRKGDALFRDLFSSRSRAVGATPPELVGQSAINCEGDT